MQSTYLDFIDGTFTDAGANTYVSADGSIRLINRWDLNNDGYMDIVLPNDHDNDHGVGSYIYWGGKEFAARQRTILPGDGGRAGTVADLNRDGFPDLVIANEFNGTKTQLKSFIYWGSKQDYSVRNQTELPTVGATAVAAGDLNGDGYPDLVFASSGYSYQFNKQGGDFSFVRPVSDIYWGSAQGFAPEHTSQLPTYYARDVKIADLNKDGFPEILFAMDGPEGKNSGVFIYWGSKSGPYSESNRTFLPGIGPAAMAVADLNHDGFPEILLANDGKSSFEFSAAVTYPLPSYIYWGGADGYRVENRTELPTEGARDVKVADLNGDGFPDLVYANHVGDAVFIYWGNGEEGANYAPRRRTALPSLNAGRCAIHDLNGDGKPDLIFSNQHDGKTHSVSSYIYWNSEKGFDAKRVTKLPTLGALDAVVADLDKDGQEDILFVNSSDGTAGQMELDSYIYWGKPGGVYSVAARLAIPMKGVLGYAAADLNNDGYGELILCGSGQLRIFWGSAAGYTRQNSSNTLPVTHPWNTSVADFNRDGYLDLAVSDWAADPAKDRVVVFWGGPSGFSAANQWSAPFVGGRYHTIGDFDGNGYLDILQTGTNNEATIFWNGPAGFGANHPTTLPSKMAVAARAADLNADGYLDLIICNLFDTDKLPLLKGIPGITAPPETAPFEAGTYIYWGGPGGFSAGNRLILPTVGALDAAVADLNNDGYLDMVVASYHAGINRHHPSYVYWGSAKGLDPANVTMLPTQSASAVEVADFNGDGWTDILFANHTSGTNHRTDSFLYWGGKNGFTPDRKLLLPSIGVHGMSRVDRGNIRDRRDEFEYISSAFDPGENAQFQTISWQADPPVKPGTKFQIVTLLPSVTAPLADQPIKPEIKFQVRFAPTREALAQGEWTGQKGPKTFFEIPGSRLDAPSGSRWIQYKATLTSAGGTHSPVLSSVTVEYAPP